MINATVRNRSIVNDSVVGAIVCHTPKSLFISEDGTYHTAQTCKLIDSLDDLDKYFGDPLLDPTIYSDLIIAKDLIQKGITLYISSVYEMKNKNDGFKKILYNGYTEFYFKENGFDVVGYKLKSDLKFCQPIISSMNFSNENNQLHLYVQLYRLDRGMVKKLYTINKPDDTLLYKTLHFTFDTNTVTDKDIIDDFDKNGLEMQIVYSCGNDKALVEQLKKHANHGLKILLSSLENNDKDFTVHNEFYHYDIHSSDYEYDIGGEDDDNRADVAYIEAIDALSSMLREPIMLCMGRMFHSIDIYDTDSPNILISSKLEHLDPVSQFGVYSVLLSRFPEECNTYLFINMPDISVSSALDLLNQRGKFSATPVSNEGEAIRLQENYNCDIFFGYATDIVNASLSVESPRKVFYSAALLSFYNLIMSNDAYMTNNFVDLNISNRCVKIVVPESSAKSLQESRCNSMVLFDIGRPSVYGDRSLSMLHNLRYSHISRNFVMIRRLIHNYLETKKFVINHSANIDSCICYIKFNILDEFRSHGVLSNYSVSYYSEGKSVFIKITLIFPYVAESIDLDFTI